MITGFNTDIEHDGVVYHVQTEDKGLDTPIILSLVYVGGAILASKRAPYEDLIEQGFSDEVLSERLKRQHRLICAAINSGRINDLKKMGARPAETLETSAPVVVEDEAPEVEPAGSVEEVQAPEIIEEDFEIIQEAPEVIEEAPEIIEGTPEIFEIVNESQFEKPTPVVAAFDEFEFEPISSQVWSPPEKIEPPPSPEPEIVTSVVVDGPLDEAYTVHDSRAHGAPKEVSKDEGLVIILLDDEEFNAGETRILRVLVVKRRGDDEKPVSSVNVSIKILGTAFRPLIYSIKTDRDGVAAVPTQIPIFTSGRAAVLIRAVAKEQAAELRRVIHPAQ